MSRVILKKDSSQFTVNSMKISVYTSPSSVPQTFCPNSVAVVIDILRATSTMVMAFSLGAKSIQVFGDQAELQKYQRKHPDALMLGERDGKIIPGFHYGNSPLKLESTVISGSQILMTTTNGARAAESVSHWPEVLTAALVNRYAAAELLAAKTPDHVYMVCSGWKGDFSAEDMAGAGALIHAIDRLIDGGIELENDEAIGATALFEIWQSDLYGLLRRCSHGKRLIRLGADDDLKWCSRLDQISTVAIQTSPRHFSPVVIS